MILNIFLFICFIDFSFLLKFDIPFDTTKYDSGPLEAFDDEGKFGVYFFYSVKETQVEFAIVGNSGGYVAVGLNDNNPGMPSADIFMCHQMASGEVIVSDMFAPRFGVPEADPHDDLVTIENGRKDKITYCTFKRARETCDFREDLQVKDPELQIYALLAWGKTDELLYHGPDGRRSQPFSLALAPPLTDLPSDVETIVVSAPAHAVAQTPGSYGCSYHDLVEIVGDTTKRHIIQYKLSRGASDDAGVLHHVNLMACDKAIASLRSGTSAPCEQLMGLCTASLLSAGYGASGTSLPPGTGLPVLGTNGPRYVVISRHFYNVALKKNVNDVGTEYTIQMTKTLRPKELSQITLGVSNLVIPPNSVGHAVQAYCGTGCTGRMGEVTVSYVGFHMHGHGIAARVRVYRDGKEIEPLADIDPFDVSQTGIAVNYDLKPNDSLLLECIYNNDLDQEITFGDGIASEMCFAFLTVTGNQDTITSCLDFPEGFGGTPPPACDLCAGRFTGPCAQCDTMAPRNYCPKLGEGNMALAAAMLVGSERSNTLALPKYTPPPSVCKPIPQDQTVHVPAIAGACPLGEKIIGSTTATAFGSLLDVQINWESDCDAASITLSVSATLGVDKGWLAVGIHDAGTVTDIVPMPATAMKCKDIVQISSTTLKDRYAENYGLPLNKKAQVATFVESKVERGRVTRTFRRPFASASGLTLDPTRFVHFIVALRTQSDDFQSKHSAAFRVDGRVSLFGGVAESVRALAPGEQTSRATPSVVTRTHNVPVTDTHGSVVTNTLGAPVTRVSVASHTVQDTSFSSSSIDNNMISAATTTTTTTLFVFCLLLSALVML